jgi:two-component system response regulator HydG
MTDRILIVDDDADACTLLEAALTRLGYAAESTQDPADALARANRQDYAAILTDLEMGEMNGLALCDRLLGVAPDVPVIVVTGHASMETAINAMRAGAYDFLTKPVDQKLLTLALGRAVQHHALKSELKRLREEAGERTAADSTLVGDSEPMRKVHELIARVARSDASVLLMGESGTGKDLVARAIHQASERRSGPFVAINCAAVPRELLESELFGHEKGAFTDAKAQRAGLFVEATGGTLFLDEIGEMPLDMQAKLLRALQERVVRPVGSASEVPFDARIVAATQRDLALDSESGRFRRDLYYRVNVVRVDLPALRERGHDILKLAAHFLERFTRGEGKRSVRLSQPVAEKLLGYDWPGNVRELENCMERLVTLARFNQVSVEDLPENLRRQRSALPSFELNGARVATVDEMERRHIMHVIKLVDGNKSRASQLLGLDRRTLYRKLERYESEHHANARPQRVAVLEGTAE